MTGLEDYAGVVRRRRMTRAFTEEPVDAAVVDRLVDLARRAPSAGNTQSIRFLVLTGDAVRRYWDVTLPEPRRSRFRWQGLLVAPVLVLPYVEPGAYVRRYAEDDKARPGLGEDADSWVVPYWFVDGGAAVQQLLLGVTAAGLGACLFGQFDHESAVRAAFGVPDAFRTLGTIAIGHPAPDADGPGRSASRDRPSLDVVVHRNRW